MSVHHTDNGEKKGETVKRSTVIKDHIAVFPASAAQYPAIDRIEVYLYLDQHWDCRRTPRLDVAALRSGELLGLSKTSRPKLDWLSETRSPFLGWRSDDVFVQQWLGGYGGRRASHKISQTITFNPLTEIAAAAHEKSAGRVTARLRTAKRNFVHPIVMSRHELHSRTIEVVMARIATSVSDYVIALENIFGIRVREADVRRSVALVELSWDVPCAIPALALRALLEPWMRGLPETKLTVRGKSAVPTEWEYSAWSDGTLRAQHAKGHSSKVYPPSRDTLRFEAQLHANGQHRLLCRRIRLSSAEAFGADVQQLGQMAYAPILEVQQELTTTKLMPIANVVCAGVDPRRRPTFYEIVSELMCTGRVRTRDRSRYAVLCAMRDDGCVRVATPKGYWEATPQYALALKYFLRFAEVYGS